jgi:hypothetical protein
MDSHLVLELKPNVESELRSDVQTLAAVLALLRGLAKEANVRRQKEQRANAA